MGTSLNPKSRSQQFYPIYMNMAYCHPEYWDLIDRRFFYVFTQFQFQFIQSPTKGPNNLQMIYVKFHSTFQLHKLGSKFNNKRELFL